MYMKVCICTPIPVMSAPNAGNPSGRNIQSKNKTVSRAEYIQLRYWRMSMRYTFILINFLCSISSSIF